MSDFLNSRSKYVSSLVSYINDTKPYHSKLTEITEEYRFSDTMNVSITDRNRPIRMKMDSTWLSTMFSGGNGAVRSMPIHGLSSFTPMNLKYIVGQDEFTDFANLPYAYSKVSFDGVGVADVQVKRLNGILEPYLEGHDYFLSHGSTQIRIWQTTNVAGQFDPKWSETRDETVISRAALEFRKRQNDLSDSNSLASKVLDILQDTKLRIQIQPTGSTFEMSARAVSLAEVDGMIASILAMAPNSANIELPRTYKKLFDNLVIATVSPPAGFSGWRGPNASFVEQHLETLYNQNFMYFNQFAERGVSNSRLNVLPNAPLEVWDIIKVNPIAYTRPLLNSNRYGWIQNATGVRGEVTVNSSLALGRASTTFVLTATSSASFTLTSTADVGFSRVVPVGSLHTADAIVPVSFRIMSGSAQMFTAGDRFYIGFENDPPKVESLDIHYPYDLDSYDGSELLNDIGEPINFNYGSRFIDFSETDLTVTPSSSVAASSWEIRAIPNLSMPIATVKKDGTGPDARIDLQELTSGISPDVALNAAALYSMPSIPNSTLTLYYATIFNVFRNGVQVGTMSTSAPFTSNGIQIEFSNADRDYIAVVSSTGLSGGDVITFSISNPDPILNSPITLVSENSPQIVMHGDGFHETIAANWTIAFGNNSSYSLFNSTDSSVGSLVANGTLPNEGASIEALNVHFTIRTGSVGVVSGDTITFSTFDSKPSYLVHGSVSGFTEPAEVGVPYNNGFIEFTIQNPSAVLHDETGNSIETSTPNEWVFEGNTIRLERLRFDAPNLQYTLTPNANGFAVFRSDIGVIGFVPYGGSFKEKYITLSCSSNVVSGSIATLIITADEFVGAVGQNAVILNTSVQGRLPNVGEEVIIDKRLSSTLDLSLDYAFANTVPMTLNELLPSSIGTVQNTLSTDTGYGGVPLVNTSPETSVITNFIPLHLRPMDSMTSTAIFSDSANRWELYTIGTNEFIGGISAIDGNFTFEFDADFAAAYFPLNTEANLIVRTDGTRDKVHVNIAESIHFLIRGTIGSENAMFDETMNVSIVELNSINVSGRYFDTVGVSVNDGVYNWPILGYDSLPLDTELNTTAGFYDVGDFADVGGNGSLGFTTQNPELTSTSVEFSNGPAVSVNTSIQDSFTMFELNEDTNERTAIFNVQFPYAAMTVPAGTYINAETPFEVYAPYECEIFEFYFQNTAAVLDTMPDPIVILWLPFGSPVSVPVTKIGIGRYRVTNAVPTSAKLFLS